MRAAARGHATLEDDPAAAQIADLSARFLHSLRVGLLRPEDVPYHWHTYVLAYDIGLKERELDAIKKDEDGYTNGGKVASPSRANEIVRRLQEEQGARR